MIGLYFLFVSGFAAGFLLGRGVLSDDVVRVLLVGLGFVAASVLPTITLLVNGMTSTGRSVKAVNDLHAELASTVGKLFTVLGLALLSVLLLLPFPFQDLLPSLQVGSVTLFDPIGKVVSGLVFIALMGMFVALRAIPSAIYRSLDLRRAIAVEEAKQRNADRLAQVDANVVFATKDGFGEKVSRRVDA